VCTPRSCTRARSTRQTGFDFESGRFSARSPSEFNRTKTTSCRRVIVPSFSLAVYYSPPLWSVVFRENAGCTVFPPVVACAEAPNEPNGFDGPYFQSFLFIFVFFPTIIYNSPVPRHGDLSRTFSVETGGGSGKIIASKLKIVNGRPRRGAKRLTFKTRSETNHATRATNDIYIYTCIWVFEMYLWKPVRAPYRYRPKIMTFDKRFCPPGSRTPRSGLDTCTRVR